MTSPVSRSHAVIAAGSQSFAAAAKLMPAGIREDTVMLYAWCRHADDVVDGQELGSAPEAGGHPVLRLGALKAETLDALHGSGPLSLPLSRCVRSPGGMSFPMTGPWP